MSRMGIGQAQQKHLLKAYKDDMATLDRNILVSLVVYEGLAGFKNAMLRVGDAMQGVMKEALRKVASIKWEKK